MARKRNRFIKKLRYFFKPTVGKLLGLLMAAYFVFSFISIKGRTVVNYYEVGEGSLVKEHNYTGLILREEEIVNADAGGYIYYYVADGRKVASGSPVYLIDTNGDLSYYLNEHTGDLTGANSSKLKEIRSEILYASRKFADSDFGSIYDIHDSIEAKAIEYSSLSLIGSITDELNSNGIRFENSLSPKNGTVCCYTDGYENIDENSLSDELFNQTEYKRASIKAGDLVEAGTPAYKLITSENWSIAFKLTDEDKKELDGKTVLKISFKDKGFDTRASFKTVYGNDGAEYGLIMLNSYLVQFTADRFVSFEIVSNDVSGLKIPDKAITTKDFYIIPTEYLVTDAYGNSGFNKAVVGDNGTSYEFEIIDIYSKDDDYCYIECDAESVLKAGDYVMLDAAALKNASAETFEAEAESRTEGTAESTSESAAERKSGSLNTGLYQIGAKMPLSGVYNVNKGYAVFRKVEILESSNGYSIVRKNTSYGLQTYDHIVLDAESVQDGEILYR